MNARHARRRPFPWLSLGAGVVVGAILGTFPFWSLLS